MLRPKLHTRAWLSHRAIHAEREQPRFCEEMCWAHGYEHVFASYLLRLAIQPAVPRLAALDDIVGTLIASRRGVAHRVLAPWRGSVAAHREATPNPRRYPPPPRRGQLGDRSPRRLVERDDLQRLGCRLLPLACLCRSLASPPARIQRPATARRSARLCGSRRAPKRYAHWEATSRLPAQFRVRQEGESDAHGSRRAPSRCPCTARLRGPSVTRPRVPRTHLLDSCPTSHQLAPDETSS